MFLDNRHGRREGISQQREGPVEDPLSPRDLSLQLTPKKERHMDVDARLERRRNQSGEARLGLQYRIHLISEDKLLKIIG